VQVPYWSAFRALGGVHLEASRVLSVSHRPGEVVFALVVLLSPSHPLYRGALPGDEHDYRAARLLLSADRVEVQLTDQPTGGLGAITSWLVGEDGWSDLQGPWGAVRASRPRVILEFD
jgi:hypothetical protein